MISASHESVSEAALNSNSCSGKYCYRFLIIARLTITCLSKSVRAVFVRVSKDSIEPSDFSARSLCQHKWKDAATVPSELKFILSLSF